jgi:hypothetical protein
MAPDDRSRPTGQQGDSQEPQEHRNTILDQALAYAARGWPVFPLKPLDKRPMVKWKDQATTNPDTIRRWWERWPDANVGLPTGQLSGLVVLDPDNGPAGAAALAELEHELGQLPPTLTVRTPGDSAKGKLPGRHLYLRNPGRVKNSAGQLGDDLDVRGDGGYVVGAGSTLADGPYTIEHDDPPAELPGPWAARLQNGTRPEPAPVLELATTPDDDQAPVLELAGRQPFTQAQAQEMIRDAARRLRDAKEGQRNHTLNATAMMYGHFQHAVARSLDKTRERLQEMGEYIGLDPAEVAATVASGLGAGMADPWPVADPEQEQRQAQDKRVQAILDAVLYADELDDLPEPEPLLPGYLNRAEYVLLAGRFGTYKSFTALAWAYAVATGQAWDDHPPAEARPVVYVAAEGITGYRHRLRALERRHGVKAGRNLAVIRRPVHLTNPDEVKGLRLVMEQTGAQLVVLDTWHRMTPGVEENSATETGGPLDRLLALRDDYGATVLLVHHTGHAQRHARGSSALEDDADASWMIKLGTGTEDEEDRSAATARTLVQRKAKDGELAEARRLRLQVDEAGQASVDLDPLELAPPVATGKPGRRPKVDPVQAVDELLDALDADGFALDRGYRQVEDWIALHWPGRAVPRAVVRSVVAARRYRAEQAADAVAQLQAGKVDPFHPGLEWLNDDQRQELEALRTGQEGRP